MSRLTHKNGIEAAETLAREFGVDITELRHFAGAHLMDIHPDLEEIGTSDVSIHLSDLGNHEPELLRAEAERLSRQI